MQLRCLCEKSKYVGKSKYSLNLRTNIQRNDVWSTDGPLYGKHFQMLGHNFHSRAKFTITEQVNNKSLSMPNICSLFEHKEEFRILNYFPARSKHIK